MIINTNSIIEKKSTTKEVSNETPLQKVKNKFSKIAHPAFASFPFRSKDIKNKISKKTNSEPETSEPATTTENESNDENPIKTFEELQEKKKENLPNENWEEWFVNLDNCEIKDVAQKEGEVIDENIPSPEIEIILYNRKTGEYEPSPYGGYELKYFYDPINNNLLDTTPDIGFGFKIGDKFIEKSLIKKLDSKAFYSYFQLQILKGNTLHGIEADYGVYNKAGFNRKLMFTLKCYETFLYKQTFHEEEKNQKILGTIWMIFIITLGFALNH